MSHIKDFSEIHKEDAPSAGGKGASLGELTNARIPVPSGFVILSSAFDAFLDETNIKADIESILVTTHHDVMHEIEDASEKIQEIIISQELPEELKKDILASFKTLGAEYVAVRSSATAEDGAEHAWAGQLDTYLNTTEDELLTNVKRCWASLFTPRAIFYRFEKGLASTHISVAVVIQKMVESEYSGIAFSVHPVTEDRNQMIIEAGYGLGEAIVSGQVTPDSYVITKSLREILDVSISEQSRALYRSSGGGNEWRELGEKGKEQVLSKEQILELGEIIIRIENHYGFPCDIEWAYEGGKFYITQSRPITTLSGDTALKVEAPFHKYSDWSKNWESQFSLLACNIGLKVYLTFQQVFGASLIPVVVHKRGYSSCFYVDQQLDAFTDQLWNLYLEDTTLLDTWIEGAKRGSNQLAEIIKEENPLSVLGDFMQCVDAFGGPNFAVREVTNRLNSENNAAEVEKVTEYRKYTELYYYNMDVYLDKIVNLVTNKTGYEKELVQSLTLPEFFSYTQTNLLPNKELLRSRYERSVAWFVDGVFTYYDGDFEEASSILHGTYDGSGTFKGVKAYGGKVKGRVKKITTYDVSVTIEPDEILVTGMTDPRFIHLMYTARGFITDAGGMLSHAAIVARELKKPCIVGTKVATKVLETGDLVEIDADSGVVRILEKSGSINENIILTKLFTRERPLFYYYAFPDADKAGIQKYIKRDVEDILFVIPPKGRPGEVWYPQKTFEELSVIALQKINSDEDLRNQITGDLSAAWEQMSPYFLQGKEIETQEEAYVYYQYVIDFWKAFNTLFFCLVDGENLNPDFAQKLKHIRDITQEHTAAMSEKFVTFFEKAFPAYAHVSFYITPKEVRDLHLEDTAMLSVLEERSRTGCFVYRDIVYPLFQLDEVAKKYNLSFQKEEIGTTGVTEISGEVAYKGKVTGRVKVVFVKADLEKVKKGDILISPITDANYVPAMQRAAAFVTDEGGVMCHAAIVAREMQKPSIVGTKVGTEILRDGDLVEVDADNGVVRIIT